MVQVIPKWTVTVGLGPDDTPVVLAVYDHHISGVLSVLGRMDFGNVRSIAIELQAQEPTQTSATYDIAEAMLAALKARP